MPGTVLGTAERAVNILLTEYTFQTMITAHREEVHNKNECTKLYG
jgi:hypothetical protein